MCKPAVRIALTSLLLLPVAHISAEDTRTLAMGSASVTAGKGASGALANPALMMEPHRLGERYHFNLNLYSGYRDNADLVNEFDENKDLLDDIDTEIDSLTSQTITCTTGDPNEVCLTGTQSLANLADRVRTIFNNVDGEPFDARAGTDLGFMVSGTAVPFFVSIGATGTVVGQADISEGDKEYVATLANVLGDNNLTLSEIQNSAPLALDTTTNTVAIDLPDDVLDSSGKATAAVRATLAVGFARTFSIAGQSIDFGITPKFSSVRVGDVEDSIKDINDDDDNDTDISDDFEASENTETTFTFDLGALMTITDHLIVGAVAQNVVGETVKTLNDVAVETTPQLIVSGLYDRESFRVSADLALNEAKLDNYKTQALSLGAETGISFLRVRAGIKHDLSVANNPTDFTVGLGLGPLNFSAAFNGDVVRAGMQINASF